MTNESAPCVLVVDDSHDVLRLLVHILEEEGYLVSAVDNGADAISVALANPPDLILLDVRLKDTSGLEICRELKAREETRGIPVVLLSGYAEMNEWLQGVEMGAVDFISKPFANQELIARVKNHVSLRLVTLDLEKRTALLHQANERLKEEIVRRQTVEEDLRINLNQAHRSRRALLSAMEDRKQAEEQRKNLEAQLIQSQKMEAVGRLAGGVAHDFNNMLGVILGHAEMLFEQTNPESFTHDALNEIILAARRSEEITRQLLAFSRRQIISPRVIDLNETVESALKMIRRLIGEEIDLIWNPKANLWAMKADPSQIDQLLTNLCLNARDAIREIGKIEIETDNIVFDKFYCIQHNEFVSGEFVMLAVSDNGSGMSRETLNHIFEPFFTTKDVGKGTGLGLAMVYGIVNQNNGCINVYSEPGQGSTFKIYFPRHAEPAAVNLRTDNAKTPLGAGETVLVVEDETSLLKLAKRMLHGLGYKVLTAETPEKAILVADSHGAGIHLMITDLVMPGMNGRDLAERLKGGNPDLKILFMSGYTADIITQRGLLEQGVHFIQKPFAKKELALKVREALKE